MGKVVDMLYFPIIDTTWPAWVPFVGGDHFIFFSPVFNFADSCITVGVILMLICCRRDLELMGETVRRGLHLKKKDDKKRIETNSLPLQSFTSIPVGTRFLPGIYIQSSQLPWSRHEATQLATAMVCSGSRRERVVLYQHDIS